MKKIIALFVMFLAFTANSNAQTQDKSITNEINAKKDYEVLAEVVNLSPQTQDAMVAILRKKYDALSSKPNMTADQKREITSTIEHKIKQILGPETLKELEKHKSVYARLVSPDPIDSEKK
jgi:hypothetical protein